MPQTFVETLSTLRCDWLPLWACQVPLQWKLPPPKIAGALEQILAVQSLRKLWLVWTARGTLLLREVPRAGAGSDPAGAQGCTAGGPGGTAGLRPARARARTSLSPAAPPQK